MRACLVLCVAAALIGAALAECGACIGGQCYHKHRLPITGVYYILMDIDRNQNILYVGDGPSLKQCQLDTQLCDTKNLTKEIRKLSVDQRSGDTYGIINDDASGHGLYKLDLVNYNHTLLTNTSVQHIVFKDKLYYSPWHGNGVYAYENGESHLIPGTEKYKVWYFIVDKKDDIYIRTYHHQYVTKRVSKGVVGSEWDENYLFTADKDGNAVLIHAESHNVVFRETDGQLVELGDIRERIQLNNIYQMPLFDKNNDIVAETTGTKYIYLKRDKDVHCSIYILENRRFISEAVGAL